MATVGALLGAAVVLLLTRLVPLRPSPLVQLGQVDARHPRTGADECLGAGQPDAPLRTRDEGDAPVEPPRPGGGSRPRAHRRATIASISTGMSNGRCGTPTDVRAPRLSWP